MTKWLFHTPLAAGVDSPSVVVWLPPGGRTYIGGYSSRKRGPKATQRAKNPQFSVHEKIRVRSSSAPLQQTSRKVYLKIRLFQPRKPYLWRKVEMSCWSFVFSAITKKQKTRTAHHKQTKYWSMCENHCVPQPESHDFLFLCNWWIFFPLNGSYVVCEDFSFLVFLHTYCRSSKRDFPFWLHSRTDEHILSCGRKSTQFWSNTVIRCPRSESCVLRILLAVLQKHFQTVTQGSKHANCDRTNSFSFSFFS